MRIFQNLLTKILQISLYNGEYYFLLIHGIKKIGHHARLGENNHLFAKQVESSKETHLVQSARARVHAQMTQDIEAQCNTYTLFDGLTGNTRGYFTSCVVFFRAPQGREKMRAMSKMTARIICETIE